MAKILSKCPAPPSGQTGGSTPKSYQIHVVTPLVGGGVEAGKNDLITLIRGASIRGQLRFWWRASRGARFNDSETLYKKEGEIWGTSKSPSQVSIEVKNVAAGTQNPCAEFPRDTERGGFKSFPKFQEVPGYVMFPFQGKVERCEIKQDPAKITRTASFTLDITMPESCATDVEAAVWAWVNFGGLGARTRRGCGSLFCKELAPTQSENVQSWYTQKLQKYEITVLESSREWPTLPGHLLIHATSMTLPKAWEKATDLLKKFRQGADVGRNPGTPQRPGRSRWPEADSLRRITKTSCSQHAKPITTKEDAFPRAELGLPIVFHFKDIREGDPQDSELYPKGSQRMASPLILKPLALQKDLAVPLILNLQTKPLAELELKKISHPPTLDANHIRRPDLTTYSNAPMAGLSANGSAREAFLNFARKNGFC